MSLRKRAARTGSPFSLFSPSFGGVGEVSLPLRFGGVREVIGLGGHGLACSCPVIV